MSFTCSLFNTLNKKRKRKIYILEWEHIGNKAAQDFGKVYRNFKREEKPNFKRLGLVLI